MQSRDKGAKMDGYTRSNGAEVGWLVEGGVNENEEREPRYTDEQLDKGF